MRYAIGLWSLAGMCLGVLLIATGLDLNLTRTLIMGGIVLSINSYVFMLNLPAKL